MAAPMIAAAALLLSGCGSTIDGTPTAATDVVSATTSAKPTTTSKSPGGKSGGSTTTPRSGGRTDFQASIGDCVKLGGTQDDATIEKATCGSANSNFKVVAKARNSDACSADTDQAYYETLNGIETGAICLEIDWVVGECMELDNIAQRITCSTPGTIEGVKVLEILTGSTDVNDCKNGDRGYVYEERRKVVCVQSL
ncbi:hypothetical protein JK358_02200 [Nocardia sp. 2]|uniref:LppU protein n=2 Tax=Nocardia acididurans TaxID=2802282 RepID=A0ABS1LYD3_9NOCA|nr:hypothetical protein [Nocardia acididurans]